MLIHVIHYDHERQCCLAFWNFTEERYQGTEYYQQPHHLISYRIKQMFSCQIQNIFQEAFILVPKKTFPKRQEHRV